MSYNGNYCGSYWWDMDLGVSSRIILLKEDSEVVGWYIYHKDVGVK